MVYNVMCTNYNDLMIKICKYKKKIHSEFIIILLFWSHLVTKKNKY